MPWIGGPYPDVRPTVTFRFQHECGNILIETYYFSEASFTIQHEPRQEATGKLDGMIEAIENGGIQFINKKLACARCGQSVVFPDRKELSNPG